jgi:hypothetical protein
MRIQLSEPDRTRFGCPEWLTVDLSLTTLNEMEAIQKAVGFDSDEDLIEAWDAQFQKASKQILYDRDAWRVIVWLGLRNAGVFVAKTPEEMATEIVDLDCQVKRIRLEADPGPGKDQTSSSTPSTTSDSSDATTVP